MEFKEAKEKVNQILEEMNNPNSSENWEDWECKLNGVYTYYFCNDTLKKLINQKNNISRRISALKKANLKTKPNINKDGEETELATCVFCGELFDSVDEKSDCGCHDNEL